MIDSNWINAKLGDICDVILGQSPPGNTYNTDKNGLPFYQGKAEFGDLYPTPQKWCDKPKKIAEKGDTLISVRAPVGPTNMCTEKSCIGRGLAALRPNKDIPTKYILYAVRATVAKLKEQETGSTFGAISGTQLKNHKIPLAPKDERKSIVEEIETQFTRLDAGVAALKRAQANLKRYRAAVLKAACEGKLVPTEAELAKAEGRSYETGDQLLQSILAERRKKWEAEQKKTGGKKNYVEPKGPDVSVLPKLPKGWAWATVEQVSSIGSGNTPAGIKKYLNKTNGLPWYKVGDMNKPLNMHLMQEADNYLSKADAAMLGLRIFPKGTIIFPKRGGAIATNKKRILQTEAATDLNIMGLIANANVAKYFKLWFSSLNLATLSDGSNVPQINNKDILPIKLPIPPNKEQNRIVDDVEKRLSVIDKQEVNIAEKLIMAGNLRNAILTNSFKM